MRISIGGRGLAGILLLVACGCGKLETNGPATVSQAAEASLATPEELVSPTTIAATKGVEPPAAESTLTYGAGEISVEDQHPEAVVREYLEAAKSGDPTTVNQLLTSLARKKAQEMDLALAPPVSETARFDVLGHEFIDSTRTISHVASRWTETGPDGETDSASIIWVTRLEADGWRIAGMIVQASADQPPMPFNFEDPEGILRQQDSEREEVARRPQ